MSGESLNAYRAMVTAEMRLFWPPLAPWEDVEFAAREALEALEDALQQARQRRDGAAS